MSASHSQLVALSDERKLSKLESGYATDGPFRCGLCEYFNGDSGCRKVNGYIRPEDCCDLFEAKKKG